MCGPSNFSISLVPTWAASTIDAEFDMKHNVSRRLRSQPTTNIAPTTNDDESRRLVSSRLVLSRIMAETKPNMVEIYIHPQELNSDILNGLINTVGVYRY